MDIDVHKHALRHGLLEADIKHAWVNAIRKQHRPSPEEDYAVAVGFTSSGKFIQMVAVQKPVGYLIIHAMEPPQASVLRELDMTR